MVTPMVGLLVDYGRGVVVVKRPTVDTERWGVCARHSGPFIFLLKSSKQQENSQILVLSVDHSHVGDDQIGRRLD